MGGAKGSLVARLHTGKKHEDKKVKKYFWLRRQGYGSDRYNRQRS
jgi:hypothetical protein